MTGVRQPVFLDVDTGVDDAMALVYLFGSAEADLVGIASTAGNVPVQQVCQNNLALLELCDESIDAPDDCGKLVATSGQDRRMLRRLEGAAVALEQ